MSNIKKIFTSIGLLSVGFIILNTLFIYPSADDYSYYISVNEQGFWMFQKWHYLNWGGRYIPNALLGSFPLDDYGIWIYRIAAIAIVLGLYSSLALFVKKIFKIHDTKTILYFGSVLFLGYTLSLYSISQQFYWLPGSLTYTFSCILCLLVWSYIQQVNAKLFFPLLLAVFIINGTNEISIILFNASLILFVLYTMVQKEKNSPFLYTLIACSLVFGAFSILAPGNSVRADSSGFENTKDLLYSVPRTINRSIILILEHFYNLFFVLLALFPFLAKLPSLKLNNIPNHFMIIIKWGLLLFPFGVLFLGVFPSYWATGRIPPQRAVNTVSFFFMFSMIFSLMTYYSNFKMSNRIITYFQGKNTGIILMLISLFLLPNYLKSSIIDLFSGKSYQFSKQMQERINYIKNTTEVEIEVAPIEYPTIAFKELSEDKNYYYNTAYAKYYKKKSITLKKK